MRSILYFFQLFFILFSNFIIGQQISGEIYYAFKPNNISIEERADKKELFSVVDKMNASARDLTFILSFNNTESVFNLEEQLESDLSQNVLSYAKNIISKGRYYYNKQQDLLLRESQIYDKYTLIKSNPSIVKWEITKKSKMIGGYLCYKANQIIAKESSEGKRNFVVEAWFTPQIPVSFGPKEYNNLPGLILEVTDPLYTFYATKVKLSSSLKIIKPLQSKNIITEEDNIKNFQLLKEGQ